MWRLKFLAIGMVISLAFGAVLFFVGRASFDWVRDEFREDAIAAVDEGFQPYTRAEVQPGRLELSERELTRALNQADAQNDSWNQQGLVVDCVDGEIRLVDQDTANPTSLATLSPTIVDGKLELGDPSGVIGIIFPMGTIATRMEENANAIFARNNVVPTSVTVTDRGVVFELEPAPGAPAASPTARAQATNTPRAVATPTPRPASNSPTPVPTTETPAAATTPTPRIFLPPTGLRTPTPTP